MRAWHAPNLVWAVLGARRRAKDREAQFMSWVLGIAGVSHVSLLLPARTCCNIWVSHWTRSRVSTQDPGLQALIRLAARQGQPPSVCLLPVVVPALFAVEAVGELHRGLWGGPHGPTCLADSSAQSSALSTSGGSLVQTRHDTMTIQQQVRA